ncbi:MAG: hypothetical protein NUV56_03260, partial [Candidatus Uhrbacteria bacterium]|nr:hypothetical protein [Candidatus Uhrbacteria bacterium]
MELPEAWKNWADQVEANNRVLQTQVVGWQIAFVLIVFLAVGVLIAIRRHQKHVRDKLASDYAAVSKDLTAITDARDKLS